MKLTKTLLSVVLWLFAGLQTSWADDEFGQATVVGENCTKSVAFTYQTTSKTLNVVRSYTLTATQSPNTRYDHTTLAIPFAELTAAMGTTVSTENMNTMTYFPLATGGYDHNNDNWYDKQGRRSSWGGESWWFMQPVTTDAVNYSLWVGQAGMYNAQYKSSIGDTYTSTLYLVGSGTKAVELNVVLQVKSGIDVETFMHLYEMQGTENVRDLGGWTTEHGETVRYGLLIRGSELQGDCYTATASDLRKLHDELGIRAELDLRTHAEAKAIKASPMGSDVDYLRVVNDPFYVDGARTAWANYRGDFDFILSHLRRGEPVYFHCIYGADRTGTLAFLLEGLLGLSEEDLCREYELTQLAKGDGNTHTRSQLTTLLRYVRSFDGHTLQEKFIRYWHQRAGISLSDLNEFCQTMLGTTTDYVGGMAQPLDNLAYNVCGQAASFTHATTNLYTINDGIVGFSELPENKHWNTWDPSRGASQWLSYTWSDPQTIERVRVAFWSDSETPGDHVLVPASWKIQYHDEEAGAWKDVSLLPGETYTQGRYDMNSVRFTPVVTRQLRLVMRCQGNGSAYSAVGVTEWEVLGHYAPSADTYGDYPIQNVDFANVHLSDGFWLPRMEQNQRVTIPFAIQQCYDSRRVLNFQKAAAALRGENIGYFDTECTFDDTDIYKILEGMAYSVQVQPNAELSAKMDELIAIVGAAQEPDGYLYTARTAGNPMGYHGWVGQNRWEKDPDLSHELYNAGHLYEAAYAHYISTGKTTLLDIATKNADLLVHDFLQGGLTYEPGHQIVEMGLVKLYRATGKEDYLKLAKYFLDLRGTRGVMRQEYSQTHKPVVMQDEAVGHAVRAAYMYAGMADVAALMGDKNYLSAIDRIWQNVAEKKFYINGGIGARHSGEAFGANYELPNKEAYCETCAAIANVYWNWRMFLLHGESKYYDVLERSLYNGVISGINLAGNRFFYPNPLASDGNGYNGRSAEREPWFGCACCPSNLCRFIASVPGYVYAHKDNKVYVNLYMQGKADIDLGNECGRLSLTQTTDYPWDGDIQLTVGGKGLIQSHLALMLRLPGWAKGKPVPSDLYSYVDATAADIVVKVNGTEVAYTLQDGYMTLERDWADGDVVTFSLPMPVRHVTAHEAVEADKGLVVIERGPIVYCMEGIDNADYSFTTLICNDAATASLGTKNIEVQGTNYSVPTLVLNGEVKDGDATHPATLNLIPYYAWNNRGRGYMQVWMPRTASAVRFEAYPTVVKKTGLNIVHTQDITLDAYPIRDDYATHRASGLKADCDVPTLLNLPLSNFSLDMMYAPMDGESISRAKNADNGKGFWYENADGLPSELFNQPAWNEQTARIFLNIEGFYGADGALTFGYGQRPGACTAGTYTTSVLMLAPTDENGKNRAVRFNFHFNLQPAPVSEHVTYDANAQKNITAALLTRTLKAGMRNPVVLPFALTQAQAETVFGSGTRMEQITAYDREKGTLHTEPLTATTAHVPFLLMPASVNEDDNYLFRDILTENGTASSKTFTGGRLVGSYNATTTINASSTSYANYVISDNQFHLVASPTTMNGTWAYLHLSVPSGSEAQSLVTFESDGTGVDALNEEKEHHATVYDLAGRKVGGQTALSRGLYIVSGKKIVKK
ncbi:MAG: glycoside hydrolase family 127 protein [Bacteroidaceae bacterium]|nr:glycoside hydrolase family 127 protein [Bacteroidaceae bacterium]